MQPKHVRRPQSRATDAYLAEAQRLSHTVSFGWHVSSGKSIGPRKRFGYSDWKRQTILTWNGITFNKLARDSAGTQTGQTRIVSCDRLVSTTIYAIWVCQ
jgi:hypothetical protein